MIRVLPLMLVALITGCLSTSPPTINDLYYSSGMEVVPESPEEIESMLQEQREPRLQELLAEKISYGAEEVNQVSLGMPKRYVQMSMGAPAQVEFAGNPDYGNERWTYEIELPTPNGYVTERRFIYFENHQVVGWEID